MDFRLSSTTITITTPTKAALLAKAHTAMAKGDGFALATLNLDHLVKLRHDATFLQAYAAQDWVVADGNPIVWLSRLAKRPVELVPGSDMVVPLAEIARDLGRPIALLGSTELALQAAAEALIKRLPGLQVALCLAPPMGFDPQGPEAAQLLTQVEEAGIALCFLALGAPKQEILAARGREIAPHVGFASIGAGLDFLAGRQTRAPAWVRRFALEWLWRAGQSPRRMIPRYAACFAILPAEVAKAWRQRR